MAPLCVWFDPDFLLDPYSPPASAVLLAGVSAFSLVIPVRLSGDFVDHTIPPGLLAIPLL